MELVRKIYNSLLERFFKDLPELEENRYGFNRKKDDFYYEDWVKMIESELEKSIKRSHPKGMKSVRKWKAKMLDFLKRFTEELSNSNPKQDADDSPAILIDHESFYKEIQDLMEEARQLICKYGG